MPALVSTLRKTLESTVVDARDKAERGARDALTALAVGASEPFGSMSEEERKLRNRLRARGRQLGDQRDPQKGTQSIERLVREMAYEHWHRMLFARFLAENQLLIEPSSGVAISLDECEELAAEEGTDLWGLAAQFAQDMLPEIFRTDDPVLALRLPLEIRQQLQALVAGLDAEVFTASDSLGWTYQFWQTKRKKEVNDSGVKIGADELSPVTQLFTEDYMVDFLLDNTLGAWHAGKMLAANPELASTAQTEDDLRQAVALPGCPWSYLRLVKSDDGVWAPAAGTFGGWPRTAAELTCLDPCMGSGHFVVAMFERLVALRLAEGEQTEAAAVAAVIEHNLFGLEIDPRCTQIAAFNLALAAWRSVGHCKLPAMNLACSGLAPNTREADWLAMAGDNEKLQRGMEWLYRLFQKAALLGSLINPRAAEGDLLVAAFHELQPLMEKALAQETQDDTAHEIAVTARGLAKAAEILAGQYTLVATNVPYLGRGKHDDVLRAHLEANYNDGKADLAIAFVARCFEFCTTKGTTALVTPQNWLFLSTYRKFREALLSRRTWNALVSLGEEAWSTFGVRGPRTVITLITATPPASSNSFFGIELATNRGEPSILLEEKAMLLANCAPTELNVLVQAEQLQNPEATIGFSAPTGIAPVEEVASFHNGICAGDRQHFVRCFWEIASFRDTWEFQQSTVDRASLYGGRELVFFWQNDAGCYRQFVTERLGEGLEASWIRGKNAWQKRGVLVSAMNDLPVTLFTGHLFDENTVAIIPDDEEHLPALWAYLASPDYSPAVRLINQAMKVRGPLVQVPFDLAHWQKVAAEKYPHGLPKPFSSDPTQWLFSGHPAGADQPLHVAVARLVGYLWPRQTGSSFPDCPALDPDRLDELADEDGIVCLSAVRGEASAVERLRKLLNTALGDEWSSAKERELLLATAVENNAKKPEPDLESWLRSSFFSEHCKRIRSGVGTAHLELQPC